MAEKTYANGDQRNFAGVMSRTAKRVALNLGIISGEQTGKNKKWRSDDLELYDAYYENRQYDQLMGWEEALERACTDDEYTGVRKRKPRIIYNLAKAITSQVAEKIVGNQSFPKLVVEDDPDTTQFVGLIVKLAKLESILAEPVRRTLNAGSGFVRFKVMVGEDNRGALKVESYLSKYCYPKFSSTGELTEVRIQYVYSDPDDLDEKGKPREKWYRLDLGMVNDILYDNPIYSATTMPQFEVVESVPHGLGYVQGEWMRTCEEQHSPDGYSLIEDSLCFIDDMNYSLSQSSQAISYNQEPLLTIKGMDTEEMDKIVKTSAKALNLGRDGEANYLETTLGGVERAEAYRDKLRLLLQDVTRLILHDPEKMNGNAVSGKALEVLNAPFVALVNELRPIFEEELIELTLKITITVLQMMQRGVDFGLIIPPNYQPKSLNITAQWSPVFPPTLEDLKQKVAVGIQVANASILSRETVTRWIAKDFGVEDIEEEIAKVAAQPVINPFGAF